LAGTLVPGALLAHAVLHDRDLTIVAVRLNHIRARPSYNAFMLIARLAPGLIV